MSLDYNAAVDKTWAVYSHNSLLERIPRDVIGEILLPMLNGAHRVSLSMCSNYFYKFLKQKSITAATKILVDLMHTEPLCVLLWFERVLKYPVFDIHAHPKIHYEMVVRGNIEILNAIYGPEGRLRKHTESIAMQEGILMTALELSTLEAIRWLCDSVLLKVIEKCNGQRYTSNYEFDFFEVVAVRGDLEIMKLLASYIPCVGERRIARRLATIAHPSITPEMHALLDVNGYRTSNVSVSTSARDAIAQLTNILMMRG